MAEGHGTGRSLIQEVAWLQSGRDERLNWMTISREEPVFGGILRTHR